MFINALTRRNHMRHMLFMDDGNTGGSGGSGDPGTGDPGTGDQKGGGTGGGGDDKTVSQEIMNQKMSELRAESKKKEEALMKKFTDIQNRLNLSEKEKEEIAQSLEETRTAGMTQQQKLEHELDKTKKKLAEETGKLTDEAGTWKQRFEDQQVTVQIQSAVSENKGIDSEHFQALMRMWGVKVKEMVDEDKPTGQYEVRVSFPDVDAKTKKPVTLDLTVGEAVKRMTEMDKHKNLFRHSQSDGTGLFNDGQGPVDKGELPDFSKMTAEEYGAWAEKNPALIGG